MATNSSEHLGLHLWEPTDQVLRTEFNQNWTKIDTAVAETREEIAAALTPEGGALPVRHILLYREHGGEHGPGHIHLFAPCPDPGVL